MSIASAMEMEAPLFSSAAIGSERRPLPQTVQPVQAPDQSGDPRGMNTLEAEELLEDLEKWGEAAEPGLPGTLDIATIEQDFDLVMEKRAAEQADLGKLLREFEPVNERREYRRTRRDALNDAFFLFMQSALARDKQLATAVDSAHQVKNSTLVQLLPVLEQARQDLLATAEAWLKSKSRKAKQQPTASWVRRAPGDVDIDVRLVYLALERVNQYQTFLKERLSELLLFLKSYETRNFDHNATAPSLTFKFLKLKFEFFMSETLE